VAVAVRGVLERVDAVVSRLSMKTLSVLVTAAELAGDRPINTVDLFLAALATEDDPASGVLRAVGLTAQRVAAADPTRTESDGVRLSGFVVTAELAAVVRATLDQSSPDRRWVRNRAFSVRRHWPPTLGQLLAAVLERPTDATRLLAEIGRPVDILPRHLRTGLPPTKPAGELWLDRPFDADPRGGPRIRAVRFAVVAGPTLALLSALIGLDALTHSAVWAGIEAAPVLLVVAVLLDRARAGRLALWLTLAAALSFLVVGIVEVARGADPVASLAVLTVPYLVGVACCACRGRPVKPPPGGGWSGATSAEPENGSRSRRRRRARRRQTGWHR
jgi:hypothetical protein